MTHPDDQCCMSKRQSGQLTTMPLVTLRDGAVEAARLRDLLDHHITRSTPLGGLGVFEIRGVGARGQALDMPVGQVSRSARSGRWPTCGQGGRSAFCGLRWSCSQRSA